MNLIFGNQSFILHPSGALLWPAQSMLIVSDLHLEKGSHYAQRGYFLPPYDSRETLERLLHLCGETGISRLLVLGDCFHDAMGYHRLNADDLALFGALHRFSPVWIKGNHDGDFVPPGFTAYTTFLADGLFFRHQADSLDAGFEISGHYHPKALVRHKGGKFTCDCFIADRKKLILPAFGAYTGGLSIDHPEIQNLFPAGFDVYLSGGGRIVKLPAEDQTPASPA